MLIANLAIFAVSLFVLIKTSKLAVKEAVKLAKILDVSLLSVGFFLMATVTSLPELSISLVSSVLGHNQMTIGTLFGSNISNLLLVVGVASSIATIKINKNHLKEIRVSLLLVLTISIFMIVVGGVNRLMGIMLVLTFGATAYLFKRSERRHHKRIKIPKKDKTKYIVLFIATLLVIIISSYFLVDSTKAIASKLGLSQMLISATILSIGTNVPDLSLAIIEAKSKKYNLLIGNLVGSCVIKFTFILGVSSIISPVAIATIPSIMTLVTFMGVAIISFLVLCDDKVMWIYDGALLLTVYAIFILISSGLLVWNWLPLSMVL